MVQPPKRGNANVRVLMATPAPPPAATQRPYGEIRAGRIDSAGPGPDWGCHGRHAGSLGCPLAAQAGRQEPPHHQVGLSVASNELGLSKVGLACLLPLCLCPDVNPRYGSF